MPSIYRALFALTAVVALSALAVAAPAWPTQSGAAQVQPQQAPKDPAPVPKDPAPVPAPIQGDLLRVDTDAKTLVIQPTEGPDMQFIYNDETKVVGGDKGVAGLATMKGTRVTVTFKMQGKDRLATQIQIHPRPAV